VTQPGGLGMAVIDCYPAFARDGAICSDFRFHEPKEALFRKSWQLNDIERVNQ
jgi:hypothetical protein